MTWSFWAPTTDESIERALDLAELRPGERFVDLGCGDGRVLVAAATRGAVVRGIELDTGLASSARRKLHAAGLIGEVIVADIEEADIAGDVVYAFLSPATIQRLASRLGRLPTGTRVLSPEFDIAGWRPDRSVDRCHLYRMPPRRAAPPKHIGWDSAGLLAALRADGDTITSIHVAHPAGQVAIMTSGPIGTVLATAAGRHHLDVAGIVAVDLRWAPRPSGTVLGGRLHCATFPPIRIIGVYTHRRLGAWQLDGPAVDQILHALADPRCDPDDLLGHCEMRQTSETA